MSIISEIKKNNSRVFRRLYMKRRVSGGDYESEWQLISNDFITKWGTVKFSIDDVKPDFYKFSGFDFAVSNYDGTFGPETDAKSFFYQSLSRYKTLVKVEAGYLKDDFVSGQWGVGSWGNVSWGNSSEIEVELPTNSTLYIGLVSWDNVYKANPEVQFRTNHLTSIFNDIPADRITGMNATLTASEIVEKIRDYTDISGTAYFQKYISVGAWTIQTTTNYYVLSTDTSLQDWTCWKLMTKLAGAENYTVRVDRVGDFYFQEKENISSTVSFHFSGIGDVDRSYGHNIRKDGITVDENIRKVYNRVKIKFDKNDTTTSYYIRNEVWTWGDSSSSFLYGVKEYTYENVFLNTATSETIGDTIYNEFKLPNDEYKIGSKFLPQLDVQERVSITYRKQRYLGSSLWGNFLYGYGNWGERLGYNIDLNNIEGRLTEVSHNINTFATDVTVRGL